MTSELSRLTSEPVWARVKNAIGWRSTWPNTSVRRSKMSPSPIRELNQRWTTSSPAPTNAKAATTSDSRMTTPESFGVTPRSTMFLSSSGTTTTTAESRTTNTRKTMIQRQ